MHLKSSWVYSALTLLVGCIVIVTLMHSNNKTDFSDTFETISNVVAEERDIPTKLGEINPNIRKYQNKVCELDKARISRLKKANLSKLQNAMDNFHEIVQDPLISVCTETQKFGGQYWKDCRYSDGAKVVCMDTLKKDIENGDCLIYSFGIDEDWTFEDMMGDFGCKVYAHDPTVNYSRVRSENVFFEKIGIAAKEDAENLMYPLDSILTKNGHSESKISYLKLDVEEYELEGLPAWLESGALRNVDQIGLEFHLNHGAVISKTQKFLNTLWKLYTENNFALISYDPNGCYKNKDKSQKYYSLAEIVLKKIQKDYRCELL